jgi:hypothetical protein
LPSRCCFLMSNATTHVLRLWAAFSEGALRPEGFARPPHPALCGKVANCRRAKCRKVSAKPIAIRQRVNSAAIFVRSSHRACDGGDGSRQVSALPAAVSQTAWAWSIHLTSPRNSGATAQDGKPTFAWDGGVSALAEPRTRAVAGDRGALHECTCGRRTWSGLPSW